MSRAVALARLPLMRLVRTRTGWLAIMGWAIIALVAALVARMHGQTSGADHVMTGTFGRFVFPLVTYVTTGIVIGGTGLRKGIRSLVGLGSPPRTAALATAVVAAAACAIVTAVLTILVCVLAHGSADPPLGADLFASTWIGLLGGAAYGAYFCAGSAIGRGGGWRGAFLAGDFLLGGGAGVGALLTPRGHVQALLGGPLCADLPQRASSILLVVMIVTYLALAVMLSRRPA